jgi:hypothetical protein
MKTPPLVITYRLTTVLISLAIIALVGLGVVGIGPLAGLLGAAGPTGNV